jgi:hypothetical protein
MNTEIGYALLADDAGWGFSIFDDHRLGSWWKWVHHDIVELEIVALSVRRRKMDDPTSVGDSRAVGRSCEAVAQQIADGSATGYVGFKVFVERRIEMALRR